MSPHVFKVDLTEFAELAYAFMTGIPTFQGGGFCMMGPDELKKQRWTYVKFWAKRLMKDLSRLNQAIHSANNG